MTKVGRKPLRVHVMVDRSRSRGHVLARFPSTTLCPRRRMVKQGTPRLYDEAFEHDSCGFGIVAQIDGHASSALVDTAFSALAKLSHRGGVNADGISGDGCGVLIRRPVEWLRALAR